mmetsp:Transcript_21212/g.55332  ORF Transcript_21212/g.55332 Transcript_21212/m.55332 type:complete len:351 (-) Transcript_21212:73-1125(-)
MARQTCSAVRATSPPSPLPSVRWLSSVSVDAAALEAVLLCRDASAAAGPAVDGIVPSPMVGPACTPRSTLDLADVDDAVDERLLVGVASFDPRRLAALCFGREDDGRRPAEFGTVGVFQSFSCRPMTDVVWGVDLRRPAARGAIFFIELSRWAPLRRRLPLSRFGFAPFCDFPLAAAAAGCPSLTDRRAAGPVARTAFAAASTAADDRARCSAALRQTVMISLTSSARRSESNWKACITSCPASSVVTKQQMCRDVGQTLCSVISSTGRSKRISPFLAAARTPRSIDTDSSTSRETCSLLAPPSAPSSNPARDIDPTNKHGTLAIVALNDVSALADFRGKTLGPAGAGGG